MSQSKMAHPAVEHCLTGSADANHQGYSRGSVDTGQPGDRPQGVALDQEMQNRKLLFTRENVHRKPLSPCGGFAIECCLPGRHSGANPPECVLPLGSLSAAPRVSISIYCNDIVNTVK